ncbi:GmrSD restriction endonuclease domain-containing protein [Thomasclavelia ramosa]|uniref:GmrSD restriction endonuclease domain-containing protein n=1 Tax=Thomasclavelia ramosa TaxID=1547 RepID=UPI0030148B1E
MNLILDGQQRLTSILLAYLGIFPNKKRFEKTKEKGFIDENDDPIDDELIDNILEWNFNILIEKGVTKNQIKGNIYSDYYIDVDFEVDDNFFDNNFLGFSYLVPNNEDEKAQQKYYSKVFRNINIQGESLLPQESRLALYYLDNDLVNYFNPEFCNKILVNDSKVDFVRYLALLSQYKDAQSINSLAKGFSRKMEKYYEEFIYFAVGEETSKIFGDSSLIFKKKNISENFDLLEKTIAQLDLFKKYESIIDLDIALFGLIYFIVFMEKEIDCCNKNELLKKISEKIDELRGIPRHLKTPSALKYLRKRVEDSISIYEEFVK